LLPAACVATHRETLDRFILLQNRNTKMKFAESRLIQERRD